MANRSGSGMLVPRSILEQPHLLGLALNSRQVADNAERAIPDRIVGTRRNGGRLVINGLAMFSELADAAGVPIGVEIGPWAGRRTPAPEVSIAATGVSIAATGLRLGEVLSAFVTQDPRYEWREMDGVIVIRPKAAWNDSEHPLSKWVENVRLDDAPIAQALDVVLGLFGSQPRHSQLADLRRISVQLPAATRLDLLNAIVKAHGELCWQWDAIGMPAPFLPPEYRHRLGFSWFSGQGGLGFGVP